MGIVAEDIAAVGGAPGGAAKAWAERRVYPAAEAAKFFGKSVRWVVRRVQAGELEGFKLPQLVVSGQSMNRFLAKRRV